MLILIVMGVVVVLLISALIINIFWGTVILGFLTAVYHFFKKEKPVEKTDYSIEQGKEIK